MDKGELIKARRKELGLSVPKLAKMLAVPKDRIYKWEKGTRPSLYEDQQKIERFLSGNVENFPILEESQADYKTKYIELLEQTLKERDQKIKELQSKEPGPEGTSRKKALG